MSKSFNKATLLGNVGKDPEIKNVGSTELASFSLATSRSWKDKNEEWQEETQWHRINAWGYLAGYVANNIKKGSRVFLTGEIRYSTTENEGITKYYTDITAKEIICLDPKKTDGENNYSNERNESVKTEDSNIIDEDDGDVPF